MPKNKPHYLLQADFSVRSSGETYCAVPTKEFALALNTRNKVHDTDIYFFLRLTIKIRTVAIPCLLSDDNCFAVPKSVIWMCISSLRRIFSGFRSLKCEEHVVIYEWNKVIQLSLNEKHHVERKRGTAYLCIIPLLCKYSRAQTISAE